MTTKKTAAAAEKAEEDERPYYPVVDENKRITGLTTRENEIPAAGPAKLRHLSTDQTKAEAEVAETKPVPWSKGPQIGERQLKDSEYLANFATPQELGVFRAAVQARRAKAVQASWRDLPDGTRVGRTTAKYLNKTMEAGVAAAKAVEDFFVEDRGGERGITVTNAGQVAPRSGLSADKSAS